ncbi:MAG: NTP transferase domain-containing protein, partial [Pseudomonadota bacterium]
HTSARWIVTAATDTPFFPQDLVVRLVDAAGHRPEMIALAASGGKTHPVFGLWPISLAKDLEAWLRDSETKKVLAFVDRHERIDVNFRGVVIDGVEIDPFFNANTPEDLETAEAVHAALVEDIAP